MEMVKLADRGMVGAAIFTGVCIVVASCTTLPDPTHLGPTTTADEKVSLAVETAYQAATTGVRIAITAGLIKAPQAPAFINLNHKAYKAVCLTRVAYNYVNARELTTSLGEGCLSVVTPAEMQAATDINATSAEALALITQLSSALKPLGAPAP